MSRPHRLDSQIYSRTFRFFLTICTFQRRKYFDEASVVELVRSHFLHTANLEAIAILAYCYMPDHLHAVVEVRTNRSDFARFVRIAKQRAGFHFRRARGQPLWQNSFFDRTLRHDDALPDVLRYVINNPVRAGLVCRPEDYPHWGSEVFSREDILEAIAASDPRRV